MRCPGLHVPERRWSILCPLARLTLWWTLPYNISTSTSSWTSIIQYVIAMQALQPFKARNQCHKDMKKCKNISTKGTGQRFLYTWKSKSTRLLSKLQTPHFHVSVTCLVAHTLWKIVLSGSTLRKGCQNVSNGMQKAFSAWDSLWKHKRWTEARTPQK